MNKEMYRKNIKTNVDKLETVESLRAVYEATVICQANEREEKERMAKNKE